MAKHRSPFFNVHASIKQIKDGIIQSGIFYRRAICPVPYGEQLISHRGI